MAAKHDAETERLLSVMHGKEGEHASGVGGFAPVAGTAAAQITPALLGDILRVSKDHSSSELRASSSNFPLGLQNESFVPPPPDFDPPGFTAAQEKSSHSGHDGIQQVGAVSNTWTCSTCTFINNSTATSCEMCGAASPAAQEKTSHSGHDGVHQVGAVSNIDLASTAAPSNTWTCSTCTFVNQSTATSCEMCGAASRAVNNQQVPPSTNPAYGQCHNQEPPVWSPRSKRGGYNSGFCSDSSSDDSCSYGNRAYRKQQERDREQQQATFNQYNFFEGNLIAPDTYGGADQA